jgi:predicted porin
MSVGSVLFGQYNGVAVSTVTASYQNVTSYPDVSSRMDDIKVTAVYQFTDSIEASLMYRYSMFNNNDWQYLSAPVIATTNTGTAISIVNAGYGAPNYNVSTAGMMVKMRL